MDNRLIFGGLLIVLGVLLFLAGWLFVRGELVHMYAWGFTLAGLIVRRAPARRRVQDGGVRPEA